MKRLLATLSALVLLLVMGCDDSSGPALVGRRSEVLAALGQEVILPSYQSFQTDAAALESALQAYAAAPGTATRDTARTAFLAAMASFQFIEVMQVGPFSPSDLSPGGTDIRGEIYSWPLVSTCGVDRRVADAAIVGDTTALALLDASVRGLDAVEYLLFNEATSNTCVPTATINMDGSWAALEGDLPTLEQRRATLAHSLGVLVSDQADALVAAWTTDDFLAEFTNPTRSGSLYGSANEGLNAVADATFYLDQATKDMKLAEPAGISVCTTNTCPENLESQYAGDSLERIRQNLLGFRALIVGGNDGMGLGFDDLLSDVGAQSFRDSFVAKIDAAIAAIDQVDGTLRDALDNDWDDVNALHVSVQAVTTDLKSMFLSVLSLDPPNRGGADND